MVDYSFGNRRYEAIDLRRLLTVLASWVAWQEIEVSLAPRRVRQAKVGKSTEGFDLFCLLAGCRMPDLRVGPLD